MVKDFVGFIPTLPNFFNPGADSLPLGAEFFFCHSSTTVKLTPG